MKIKCNLVSQREDDENVIDQITRIQTTTYKNFNQCKMHSRHGGKFLFNCVIHNVNNLNYQWPVYVVDQD